MLALPRGIGGGVRPVGVVVAAMAGVDVEQLWLRLTPLSTTATLTREPNMPASCAVLRLTVLSIRSWVSLKLPREEKALGAGRA